jgi:hypothetical protein
VPGRPSEAAVTSAELADERQLRITNVYATPWHSAESSARDDLAGFLKPGGWSGTTASPLTSFRGFCSASSWSWPS